MTEPSVLWRAILVAERFLPRVPAPPTDVERPEPSRRRRVALLVAFLPLTAINLARVSRGDVGLAWPAWRLVLLDGLSVAAGAVLVAGLAFGVHARRSAKRGRYA